jgi:hypothetical protein
MYFLLFLYMLHAPPILSSLMWSFCYLGEGGECTLCSFIKISPTCFLRSITRPSPLFTNSLSLTYLLTYPWSWALLEEPPIVQLLKNFPAFYGTRRFITVFTRISPYQQ